MPGGAHCAARHRMTDRTERSEGQEGRPGQHRMTDRTERSEGREGRPGQHRMTDRTERSEGQEGRPAAAPGVMCGTFATCCGRTAARERVGDERTGR
ncbi:hypothetical protein KRM28CT15_62010 [Krasilnikovia sp. M28-CT-15]